MLILIKYFLILIFAFSFLFFNFAFAQRSTFELPPGDPLTYSRVTQFLDATARFLYTAGITLAVIVFVVSGIMYLKAGGTEANITKAKAWFKNGIIGTFIILAIGVIIKTIEVVVRLQFFN